MSSSAAVSEIRVTPESVEALASMFSTELRYRRAFVLGQFDVLDRQRCTLVIEHPSGKQFTVGAEAVYIRTEEPGAGVGLDLVDLDPSALSELEAFVQLPVNAPATQATEPKNIYDRIRQASLRERESIARQGALTERVALERTYGGSVWEPLLQNPLLSVGEVAHIARNGTLALPLVAIIVANAGWLASGEVRRALLGNPRVAGPHLERVLKAMPRAELRQLSQVCPYRSQVRNAVKRMLGE